MDVIEVETSQQLHSPLRAAREWRGISLVAAARESGLPVAQAEALEHGQADVFSSTREMIGAAVVYGSSLGIGRDEAMALLDRTISSRGATEAAGMCSGDLSAFSAAVRERTVAQGRALASEAMSGIPVVPLPTAAAATIAADEVVVAPPLGISGELLPSALVGEEEGTGELPATTHPSIGAAIAVDLTYREAWEQSTSELEEWARSREAAPVHGGDLLGRIVSRVAGPDRAERVVEGYGRATRRLRDFMVSFRAWMRQSEHGTLIVAIGIGVVAIALLVAISSVIGTSRPAPVVAKPKPKVATPLPGTTDKPATAAPETKVESAPTPIKPPAKVHVQVLNSGSQKGYAAQMAARIKALGYRIDTVGNSDTGYATSTILCPQSLSREAQRLSRQTRITTMDTIPDGSRTACIIVLR